MPGEVLGLGERHDVVGHLRQGRAVVLDDVHGAQQAGLRAVWIRNDLVPTFDVEPDVVIGSLTELPEALDSLG